MWQFMLALALSGIAAGCGTTARSRPGTDGAHAVRSVAASRPAAARQPGARGVPRIAPLAGGAPRRLIVRDVIPGRGETARPGLWASVHYAIASARGRPLATFFTGSMPVQVGGGMVLRGWDLGMRGMRVGGRREIVIPAALGYGSAGHPPDVRPNEALIVIVDLLRVSKTDPLLQHGASAVLH